MDREDPLEKGVATHSSTLAWRILWQRSLAGYSSSRHEDLVMNEQLSAHTHTHTHLNMQSGFEVI